MNGLSVQAMARLLTKPYRRGAEILEIPLGADAGGSTNIALYDFREYRARYQADPPQPKYVLFPLKNTGNDELLIEVTFSLGGVEQTTALKVPARTFAGISFAIPLPVAADATLRLLRFRQLPVPLPGPGKDNWGFIALLGNIAKLAWVSGWEKDHIRRHLQDIQQQRRRAFAHGFSLDKLGEDLRVPRFPPREHSFDANTIALYHLNDVPAPNQAEVVTVADDTSRFGLPGHPGNNNGVKSRVTGKFGTGFQFSGAGFIEIPTHADFNIAANGSFTVEAFVKAEASADPSPRIVIMKRAQESLAPLTIPGWSLALGSFRGIDNNVMWAAADGVNEIKIFADANIADGRFHHLAGMVDRARRRTRLFVDGEERANADMSALGAVTNGERIRLGRSAAGNQFLGVIDEVRLSNAARGDFHPVLGESDAAYRQRLGIFERWLLPTPAVLLETINSLVQITGQPDSFVLIEKDRLGAGASKLVRILPASLAVAQSIDREGNLRSKELEVSGVPADEVDFKEIYLLRHDRPQVDYGANENNRRMQAATQNALEALLEALAAAAIPGNLIIDKSFDPNDAGLHRVGRALLLRHQNSTLEQLAVQAHRAGFDFVRNDTTHIYASVAAGENLAIVIEPRPAAETPPAGIDVFIGKAISLHIAPESLPDSGQIKWTLIPCGAGRARFAVYEQTVLSGAINAAATTITVASSSGFPSSPPFKIRLDDEIMAVTAMAATTWTVTRGVEGTTATPHANGALVTLALRTPVTSRPHLRLIAEAPGEIAVRVEYTSQRRTVTGTRTLRIGIETLSDGQTIAANGDMKIKEEDVVGKPGEAINPIYLITSNAAVNFGADPNNKKMQIVLEQPFNRLVTLLAAASTGLQMIKAFDPADTGLHKAGRAMRFRHNTINAEKLGALAHQAGFDFVRRQKVLGVDEIYCSVAAGEKIEIARASDLKPLPDELTVGNAVDLRARFTTLPPTGNYNWSLERVGNAQGAFDFVLRPQVKFTAREPGLLLLNVTYLEPEPVSTFPYTFEIKLKPALDVPGTIIPKHQYDLIMNILNYFHPIGVEVVTRNIREHVVEVKENLLNAFPGYTYPDFRI